MGLLLHFYYKVYRFFIKKTWGFKFTGSKQENFGSFVYFSRCISSFPDLDIIPDGISLVLNIAKYKDKVVEHVFNSSLFIDYVELSLDTPETFSKQKEIKEKINNYLDTLDKKDLFFNLGGANGTDNGVGLWCIENKVPYKLYLPFRDRSKQISDWTSDQKKEYQEILKNSNNII